MAINFVGSVQVVPFSNRGEFDPLGAMIGAVGSDGDASGGAHTITWTLPVDFIYVHQFVSWRSTNIAVAEAVTMQLLTGEAIQNNNCRQNKVTTPVVENALRSGDLFEFIRYIVLPSVAPVISISKVNVNLLHLEATFRSLFFQRSVLRDIPMFELMRYST